MHGQPASPWWRPGKIEGKPSAEEPTAERPSEEDGLRERGGERDHRFRALKPVRSHGGSPGLGGMAVAALAPSLKEHGPRWKQALWEGPDQPQPVQRGEVPTPQGGSRKLGVPPVVDRVIPQAVRPGLPAPGDPTGSDASVGCRPGRTAQHAVKRAQSSRKEGDTGVGERDLEKVCDRVNHDTLRSAVAKRVRDQRVWTRIHRVRKAGAMAPEARQETVEGGPQGGPRSPVRSNRILDRLDREVERRGPRFVRDADESHGSVRSQRAG
jgi:retron-type reverse transcriptase